MESANMKGAEHRKLCRKKEQAAKERHVVPTALAQYLAVGALPGMLILMSLQDISFLHVLIR